ncbi:MAG: RING-HC finger protein [Candidatus Colwellbacteria bacterium]|nr:RING-HC finger protein [Candidatus Colwellbacteria bacterium]
MAYYIGLTFNFIRVFITGYISYKYPNEQSHTDRFHRALINSMIYIDPAAIQIPSQPILDETKDEECKDEEPDDLRCVICMGNKRKTMVLPCQHSHTCIGCVKKIDKCPVCRENIQIKLPYIN